MFCTGQMDGRGKLVVAPRASNREVKIPVKGSLMANETERKGGSVVKSIRRSTLAFVSIVLLVSARTLAAMIVFLDPAGRSFPLSWIDQARGDFDSIDRAANLGEFG